MREPETAQTNPPNGEQPPAGGPHRFKKGEPTANPRGRPRSGLAFAEMVRQRVDPALVIDLALRLAADETVPVAERLAALLPLIDRGYLRPPTAIATKVELVGAPARDWSALSLDERRAMLEAIKRVPRLAAGDGTDDNTGP